MDLWVVSDLHCMLLNSVHLSGLPISSLSLEFHVENNPKYFTLCFCQDGDCLQAALQRHQSASVWIQGKRVYCSESNTSHLREAAVSSPILNGGTHYRNEARLLLSGSRVSPPLQSDTLGGMNLCCVGLSFVLYRSLAFSHQMPIVSPHLTPCSLPPSAVTIKHVPWGDCPCWGPLSKEYEHS